MPFADINGQQINFTDSGGALPAVVFSHGFFMDHAMFDPQVAALAAQFRCITLDARGFGDTDFDGKPFSYWDSAADIMGLLDHLDVDRAALVGMSQGGFTAMRATLANPDRVRGLVLIDTDAESYDEGTRDIYRGVATSLVEHGWSDEFVGSMAAILFGPDFDSAPWTARWRAAPPARLAEPFETMVTRDDIKPRLAEINCPCLLLHGELDSSIPLTSAELIRGRVQGGKAELVIVPGAGHSSNLEAPDFVNDVLVSFLQALDD